MSDKSIQYASLHEVNLAKRRQLYKKNNKLMAFTAKAIEVKGTQGVLADSTGQLSFTSEKGDLVEGQTYDVLVSLSINKYHLLAQVVSATLSSEAISSIGSENFSGTLIDQYSVKSIVSIQGLLEARIGQSFFAKILEIKREDNLISVVLGDSTARVEAEIETTRKQISKEILDNLNTTQVYLCSDMVLRFNSSNQLVGRFNYSSNISLASDHTISSIGDLNISTQKYGEEQKTKISDILRIHERQEDSQPRKFHKKFNNNRQQSYKEQNQSQDRQYPTYHQQKQQQPQQQYQPQNHHHQSTNNSNQDVPLTIDQLEPWNNNQTFIGKILSVNIVNSGEPKNITYLKGKVGDSTGVIDFDMGQKRGLILKENDVVKFESAMNKVIDGRHFIDVKRYGSYTILNNYKISSINKSNNLSQKSVPAQGEREVVKPVQIDYNSPVKINQLILRNNRQTFLAKILSVNEEQQQNKYNDETETHFVGTAADETGLLEFDVIEQNDVLIKQGDVVRFENGLNHLDDGKHVVKIYRKGTYEIVSNVQIKIVNTTPNNPQQRNNSSQNRSHSWSNHGNHHDAPQGNYKNQGNTNYRYRSKDSGNYNQDKHENESSQRSYGSRGNYHNGGSRDNYRYSKPSYQNQHDTYHSESRYERPQTITDICNLQPGEHGQNIIGEVFELNQVTKDFNGRVVTFLKGRIGDSTANIRFDFSQKDQLKVGQVYHLKNITNKVDDDGFHYVTLGKFAHYNLAQKNNLSSVNTGEGEQNNLSSIEYVKKTVRTEQ